MVTSWKSLRSHHVVFEDEDILCLNKPGGVSVLGERNGPDVLDLAQAAGEVMLPVHRIDKVTSGLVVFAKSRAAQSALTRQFALRTVKKDYLAITEHIDMPDVGKINLPLSVGRKNRVRIACQRDQIVYDDAAHEWSASPQSILGSKRTYPSLTLFKAALRTSGGALIVARPVTGRRHQLRVHFAWIGFPIKGDPLFLPQTVPRTRTFLHAWRLTFDQPWRGDGALTIEAPLDADFLEPLESDSSSRTRDALDHARDAAGTIQQ